MLDWALDYYFIYCELCKPENNESNWYMNIELALQVDILPIIRTLLPVLYILRTNKKCFQQEKEREPTVHSGLSKSNGCYK